MDVAYTCFRNTVDIILFRLTPLMLVVRNNHSGMVSLLVLLGSGRSVDPETGKSIKCIIHVVSFSALMKRVELPCVKHNKLWPTKGK